VKILDKCKDCECHDNLKTKGLGFDGDYRSRGHWCMARVLVKYPNDVNAEYFMKEPMTYKDANNTPSWCPKLQKTFKTAGLNCPILEIRKRI
jgi:hypothetical protein